MARLSGRPFVYNIRDMYPDMALGGAIVEPGLLARVWEKLHRWALRRATRVIVLGEDMRARIIAKGIDPAKIEIARDGAEIFPLDVPPPVLDDEVIRIIRGNFKFVFLHAGNLGFYGAWETLIEAARAVEKSNPEVSLVFVGEGAQREYVENLAKNAKNVRFLPFFPSDKIASVLAAADVHVITVRRGLEGVVVPSKMYGILAAGKAIVAIAPEETDAASLGAKFGFAISADPDNPESVTAAIRSLVKDGAKVQSMGRAARAVAPDYDRVKELQKFVKIIEGAVNA